METYSKFRPTQFDHHIMVDSQENWLVAPVAHNRDSDVLTESNWNTFLKWIGPESDNRYQIHRFNHWGPGWFEIILINQNCAELVKIGEEAESALANYPVLDDMDYSEREQAEANEIWEKCYNVKDRIEYIRKHRSQFEFNDFPDMVHCVKGEYFGGYASELIG
jgi:hypothetical protein